MEIRLLRYFLAAAREENITRAAESLHISQPSLSKQLMELEQELGKRLFVRGKRKITLTEDGILLRKRADEIVALMEKTERELNSAAQVSGEVTIGGSPTPAILSAATAIRAEYPEVKFKFYSSDATDVLERLEHGSLDFAILLEPVDSIKYEYHSLGDSACWGLLMPEDCAFAKKAAIEKEDLRGVPLIIHQRIGLQKQIATWAQTEIERLNIAATYNVINGDPSAFVKSGLGYLLTTNDHLSEQLSPGLCFRILSPALKISHALVWKRYAAFSKAAEMFLERCKNRFR